MRSGTYLSFTARDDECVETQSIAFACASLCGSDGQPSMHLETTVRPVASSTCTEMSLKPRVRASLIAAFAIVSAASSVSVGRPAARMAERLASDGAAVSSASNNADIGEQAEIATVDLDRPEIHAEHPAAMPRRITLLVLAALSALASGFKVAPARALARAAAPAARRAGVPRAVVTEISSTDEFNKALESAGDSLVVVDYSTSWCGPCKIIAPKFDEFSEQYKNVAFLKVMGDSSPDADKLMRSQGVRALPSFHFWKGKQQVDTISGAKTQALQDAIEANM